MLCSSRVDIHLEQVVAVPVPRGHDDVIGIFRGQVDYLRQIEAIARTQWRVGEEAYGIGSIRVDCLDLPTGDQEAGVGADLDADQEPLVIGPHHPHRRMPSFLPDGELPDGVGFADAIDIHDGDHVTLVAELAGDGKALAVRRQGHIADDARAEEFFDCMRRLCMGQAQGPYDKYCDSPAKHHPAIERMLSTIGPTPPRIGSQQGRDRRVDVSASLRAAARSPTREVLRLTPANLACGFVRRAAAR